MKWPKCSYQKYSKHLCSLLKTSGTFRAGKVCILLENTIFLKKLKKKIKKKHVEVQAFNVLS